MNKYLAGAAAGFLATAPMTLSMILLHRQLPRRQRYPLPPYEITTEIVRRAGIAKQLRPHQRTTATLLAHFGFGALAGAVYPMFVNRLDSSATIKGAIYGVAVWGLSYLGWIPALKILSPATTHPRERNKLMVFAHLIWGPCTALFTTWLKNYFLSRRFD